MSAGAPPVDPLFFAAARDAAGAAASAAVVLAVAARPWRGRSHAARPWGPPLALALGTAVGFWMTRGRPSFPPAQAVHWLFYAALAGGACGAYEGASGRRPYLFSRGIGRAMRSLFSALLPLVLLGFQRERYWGRTEGVLWTAGLALLLFLAWNALAALETRASVGGATALGLALATALAAGSYGLAGGALFAQLAGALALALGLCALSGLWLRVPGLGAGGVAPYALLHYGLIWTARWLYELSTPAFVLLSLVPLASLGSALVPSPRARARVALALLGPTLLAAAALLVEVLAAPPDPYS